MSVIAPASDENLVWVQLSKMKYNYLGGNNFSVSEKYKFT